MNKLVLNLSKCIKITKNNINHKIFTFAGGEEHIKILDKIKCNQVTLIPDMTNSSGIMQMLLAVNSLKNIDKKINIDLFAPYFPYARQDRIMVPGEPLSIKVMADIINNQYFSNVHILDPHSTVTNALINNIKLIDYEKFIRRAIDSIMYKENIIEDDLKIVSPDAGSEKKIFEIAKKLELKNENVIIGRKMRNVENGVIYDSDFIGNVKSKICIIIDDIIDGGATFITLSKKLKENGAKKIYLIVSHGILSKGTDEIKKWINGIYTTDSFRKINDPIVQQINLFNFCPQI